MRELRETTGAVETAAARAASKGLRERAREPRVLPPWAAEVLRWAILRISRLLWRVRFSGVEHIPAEAEGGLVIAANHQTYVDPFWISLQVKRPTRYLAWSEAFGWPVVGKLMEWLGSWPLQLEGADPSAIRRSLQWLRRGGALVIFPEGGRAQADGALARFKPGAARIALEAGVPILPVTIRGGNQIWPRGWRLPRFGQLEIIYHPLYTVARHPGEDTRACARRTTSDLAEIIRSAL